MAQTDVPGANRKAPARKKPTDADTRITRPCTPQALADYGELATPPPSSPFDAEGTWRQSYLIWMSGGSWANYRGMLTFERATKDEDAFSLTVKQELLVDRMRSIHETTATMQCRKNAFGTPSSWQLRSRVYDVKTSKDFADATVEQSGKAISEGVQITMNGLRTVHKITGDWASNWSVFEAVQRLSGSWAAPLLFTLFEDLDVVKPSHRLTCRGQEELTFGGSKVQATRYDQIGQGCLPRVHYVDDRGRMILAHTALRAYILDPNVADTHQKKLAWLGRKELR